MSNVLTRAARPLIMDASAKAVLMALCDMAREPDDADRPAQAWPPLRGQEGAVGLCDWTCLSERSVQRGMRVLLAAGHVSRRQLRHGALYTILIPVQIEAGGGARSSPANMTPEDEATPVNMAPEPSLTHANMTPTPVILAPTPANMTPKALGSITKREKATPSLSRDDEKRENGSRLPADFSFPDEWLTWAAAQRGWSRADVSREAENFRDYWIAQPGARGRKSDWAATWRVWIRKSHRRSTIDTNELPTVRAARDAAAMMERR